MDYCSCGNKAKAKCQNCSERRFTCKKHHGLVFDHAGYRFGVSYHGVPPVCPECFVPSSGALEKLDRDAKAAMPRFGEPGHPFVDAAAYWLVSFEAGIRDMNTATSTFRIGFSGYAPGQERDVYADFYDAAVKFGYPKQKIEIEPPWQPKQRFKRQPGPQRVTGWLFTQWVGEFDNGDTHWLFIDEHGGVRGRGGILSLWPRLVDAALGRADTSVTRVKEW